MVGLNVSITLSFMVVGHTKFMPDSCFGLFKQCFRRHVQCLDDIATTVDESAKVNQVKMVGNESGQVFVPTYNWLSFFAPYTKKVSNIKLYHQFHFSSSSPGSVVCRESSGGHGTTFHLLERSILGTFSFKYA